MIIPLIKRLKQVVEKVVKSFKAKFQVTDIIKAGMMPSTQENEASRKKVYLNISFMDMA